MTKRVRALIEMLLSTAILVTVAYLIVSYAAPRADTASDLKVYFLDVGQGDAEYIKTPSKNDILIDGGPDNSVLNELGKVMDFGDNKIDLVVLTHPHADHLTGLVEILERYEVGEVWETGVIYSSATYEEWRKNLEREQIPDRKVKAGDKVNFGEVEFSVLYPVESIDNKTIDNINNASIINRLSYKNFSTLFTGDAETQVQKNIASSMNVATILKVAHHGSKNGLDESFLQSVRPAVGIIEVGKDNKFGHPSPITIDLLKQYAVRIFRTDQDGTIEVDSDGESYVLR